MYIYTMLCLYIMFCTYIQNLLNESVEPVLLNKLNQNELPESPDKFAFPY